MSYSQVNLFNRGERNEIPAILHLVWVGPHPRPVVLDQYISQWKTLMPEWTVRVWGNEDINLEEFDQETLSLIEKAQTGVQKADIMRYHIVFKYGGVYMDADVEPFQSLHPLLYQPFSILICHDLDVTWPYISIGFFAASPNHPVMQNCCRLLPTVELNNGAPHMNTGPRLMGRALFEYQYSEKFGLLPIQAFYRNKKGQLASNGTYLDKDDNSRLGSHLYTKMWD